MSDPTATKRLTAEAKAACAQLGDAAKKLLGWADLLAADQFPMVPPEKVRELAHALGHQGGRLDMAVSMAHTRRKR